MPDAPELVGLEVSRLFCTNKPSVPAPAQTEPKPLVVAEATLVRPAPLPKKTPTMRLFALFNVETPLKILEPANVWLLPSNDTTDGLIEIVPEFVIGPPSRPLPVAMEVMLPLPLAVPQVKTPLLILSTCPSAPGPGLRLEAVTPPSMILAAAMA